MSHEELVLNAIKSLLHKVLVETILPPFYERGLITDDYEVDVKISLNPQTAEAALRKLELSVGVSEE